MFNHSNEKDPRVTKGKVKRYIVEPEHVTPNADIEFEEGYLEGENFISLGVNHLHIQDMPEETDEEGVVTKAAVTDYTDFMAALMGSTDLAITIETFLVSKL